MDPLELDSIGCFHSQEVIRTPGHEITLLDLRIVAYRSLKLIEIHDRLPFQRDVDQHRKTLRVGAGLDERRVPRMMPAFSTSLIRRKQAEGESPTSSARFTLLTRGVHA